ncbi:GNAT family N-acetyltransferase [Parasphingorhabdus sp.]|uniref:GNAT family N-acetyltransferase n=1 Tax=Parasphingorhabdus sp. TaxID=2709688 RepID=UPI003C766E8D
MTYADTSIRLANDADASLLPAIERSAGEAFRSVSGLEWIADDDVLTAEIQQIFIAEGTVWVAETRGCPIGFITTQIYDDALHILELAVEQSRQGQGVGRQLVKTAREFAVTHNIDALTLTTFRNVPFNQLFYQKLGFLTLDSDNLPSRLAETMKAEIENGLPADRRCAMRMHL